MTLYYTLFFATTVFYTIYGEECNLDCPILSEQLVCGFNPKNASYIMFPGRCAYDTYITCNKVELNNTGLEFCIKYHNTDHRLRRSSYGESCPVFCPNHYRPVCGVSRVRDYIYRTFTNGCYMDMLNCRGEDEDDTYNEVPLEFCQRHAMKNIYKGKVVMTNFFDYRDYQ